MEYFMGEFSNVTCFYSVMVPLLFSLSLSSLLMLLGCVVSQKWRYEKEKLTSFECGFDPMSSTRNPFSLRFFLLALLFLVFDLEMLLLFPYILSISVVSTVMSVTSKLCGFVFLLVLVVGLLHELNEGSLDWKKD
uniref:NADH dehydrogenase subunit 3 n=1 Tax=Cryptonema producta TaxID=870231 RepID=UPI00223746E3|nr:NADH dehydrogenase subunit 3 [Cryptonema producta]UYR95072.1 NADH dehydrogenase subunit 3 [Cryptonema producta]